MTTFSFYSFRILKISPYIHFKRFLTVFWRPLRAAVPLATPLINAYSRTHHIRPFYHLPGTSPGFGKGGGQEFFFQNWEFACCEATCMRIARGVRGHAPMRNFFETVQFGAF